MRLLSGFIDRATRILFFMDKGCPGMTSLSRAVEETNA